MPQSEKSWLKTINEFFNDHPELEFFVKEVDLDVVREASAAGWIFAIASQPNRDNPKGRVLAVSAGQTDFAVVVRRADPAGGYPTPCMIVMDGGFPLPPFHAAPKGAMRDRATESFGDFVWQLAVETRKSGGTVHDAFGAAMTGIIFDKWAAQSPRS